MHLNFRQQVREEVLNEIYSMEFEPIYRHLQGEIFSLNPFGSPRELIKFMQEVEGNYDLKDAILHGLIEKLHYCPELNPPIIRLLLAVLWPGMDHLHYRLIWSFPGSENLFADIYWQYVELILNWNLKKTTKIATNLKFNAKKRLIHSLSSLSQSEIISPKPDNSKQHTSEDAQEMLHVLAELEKSGIITAEDNLLIRGHAIYGTKLTDMAKTRGINYKTFCRRYERLVQKVSREIRKKY